MSDGTRLQLHTANKAVANLLREEIERGALPPGTRLRQSDLARRFGVSTTPVREALASLQAEGLVQIDAHRGAIVFTPTVEDMRQCFAIRRALEPLAAAEAVQHLTDSDLDALESLLHEMRAVDDFDTWVDMNDEFHMRLYRVSGNARLQDIIESLRKSSRFYISLYVRQGESTSRADAEHEEILAACRARDTVVVRSLMRRHVENTLRGVTKFLSESASDGAATSDGARAPS
jgi:DNA-binding GntR family transcriptional regulator